jgi:hypothetical protein
MFYYVRKAEYNVGELPVLLYSEGEGQETCKTKITPTHTKKRLKLIFYYVCRATRPSLSTNLVAQDKGSPSGKLIDGKFDAKPFYGA